MARRWYGSIINRLEEGHNYDSNPELYEGEDITEYLWSDRTCYYIDKVIDQKHIIVKKYYVCADHSKENGMGHQNWLYFKTLKEHNQYLNNWLKEKGQPIQYEVNPEEPEGQEWVYRYNNWYRVSYYRFGEKLSKPAYDRIGKISFGVRNYYYDWEF